MHQAAFHVFGMELLASLDLAATNDFFRAFFRLPDPLWRGFLASTLGSGRLVVFALATFVLAPPGIKLALARHLVTNPAGAYLIRHYLGARAWRAQAASTNPKTPNPAFQLRRGHRAGFWIRAHEQRQVQAAHYPARPGGLERRERPV